MGSELFGLLVVVVGGWWVSAACLSLFSVGGWWVGCVIWLRDNCGVSKSFDAAELVLVVLRCCGCHSGVAR